MSEKMILKMCRQLKRALTLGLVLVIVLSFTNAYAQATDYTNLTPAADSKAKSAVGAAIRYLKRIEKSKKPAKYYEKILKSKDKILKRDPNYDFSKLKSAADQALKIAQEKQSKEAAKKAAKLEQRAAEKEQEAAEKAREQAAIEQQSKVLRAQIRFTNQFNDLVRNDSVNLSLSEDDEDDLKEIQAEMSSMREAADLFVTENLMFLEELRSLGTQNSESHSPPHHDSWWEYQEKLAGLEQTYKSEIVPLNQKDSAPIASNYELLELSTIAMNLYVGATLTADSNIIGMSNDADQKIAMIPPPNETRKALMELAMANAVFPKALYANAALEEKFREAFVATGWGEKVIKIALKEKKWAPAFNNLGLFMGDTMSAWIGAVDSEGRGKVYSFRILNRGNQYSSIRHDHNMIEWILPENIK